MTRPKGPATRLRDGLDRLQSCAQLTTLLFVALTGACSPAFTSEPATGEAGAGAAGAAPLPTGGSGPSAGAGQAVLGGRGGMAGTDPGGAAGAANGGGGVSGIGGGAAGTASFGGSIGSVGGGGGGGGAGMAGGACATNCEAPILTFGVTVATATRGYTGAGTSTFEDDCPAGQVVVGFGITVNQNVVGRLQTLCGIPTAPSSNDGAVAIATGASLGVEGDAGGALIPDLCPSNQVVVGFSGHSGALLNQLAVRCAPIGVAAQVVSIGPVTELPAEGGPGGVQFPATDCGSGMVAIGAQISVENWISALSLVCAQLAIK